MSNNKIRKICDQITALENELSTAIEEQGSRLRYQLNGKRVIFEQEIEEAHQAAKLSVLRWFITVRPQNYLTMPVIYGLAIPLLFLDICVSFYQITCFPIYKIAKVKRADYFVLDHQHLAYLNFIEKLHCMYCSYAVGLLAYAQEITARTEQYFCPIKHARKILGTHSRYNRFIEYGEADNFHGKLEEIRRDLAREAVQKNNQGNNDSKTDSNPTR